MSVSLAALLGFAGWAVLLVFAVLLYRVAVVFAGKMPANSWPRGAVAPAGEPAILSRFRDAHLNTLESLPIFGAIIVVAAAAGKLAITDTVAMYVLYARIAQSVTHLIGVTHWLVFIRANFFAIQLLLFAYMIWRLLA